MNRLPKLFIFLLLSLLAIVCQCKLSAQAVFNPFPSDTLKFCRMDSVLLDINAAYPTISWSTGATSPAIWAKQTGLYKVTVSDGTDTYSDSVFVSLIKYSINGVKEVSDSFYEDVGGDPSYPGGCIYWRKYIDPSVQMQNYSQTVWVAPYDGTITGLKLNPSDSIGAFDIQFVNINETKCSSGPGLSVNSGADADGYRPCILPIKKGQEYSFLITWWSFEDGEVSLPGGKISTACGWCSPAFQIKGIKKVFVSPGNQFYYCFQDSNVFTIETPEFYNIRWATGDTGNTVIIKPIPPTPTTYYFEVDNEYAACRDSLYVENFNVPFNPFISDTLFVCRYDNSKYLSASSPGYQYYEWSDGSASATISFYDTPYKGFTNFWVNAWGGGGEGCKMSDSLVVFVDYYKGPYFQVNSPINGDYNDSTIWRDQIKPPSVIDYDGYGSSINFGEGATWPPKPPPIAPIIIRNVKQTIKGCREFKVYNPYQIIVEGDFRLFKSNSE